MADSGTVSNSAINDTTNLFNRQFNQEIAYNVGEVDAVIAYFLKRGFDQVAATNTALVLLEQARKDKVPVFTLLDTLKGVTDITLNNIITQILNLNRSRATTLGYRITTDLSTSDQRNIID